MGRRVFTTTEETREVLSGNEQAIAKAKGCDPSYIYNIKNLNEPDPYAPFRDWFQDCAVGGGPVRRYIHDLETIACQFEPECQLHSLTATLVEKIKTDSESEMVLAEANGHQTWDERDCKRILDECDAVDRENRLLRAQALVRMNQLGGDGRSLRSFAVGAIEQRQKGGAR
jgi:hypothetical protein